MCEMASQLFDWDLRNVAKISPKMTKDKVRTVLVVDVIGAFCVFFELL